MTLRIPSFEPGRRALVPAALVLAALVSAAPAGVSAQPAPPPVQARILALSPDQARLAVETMAHADDHGLSPAAYLPARLLEPGVRPGPGDEATVLAGLLRYARDVHVGRLALGDFPSIWAVRPDPYDPSAALAGALSAARLNDWLDSLPPPYAGYVGLQKGLKDYRALAAAGGWTPIPEGPTLDVGDAGPRVAALRARLMAEDPAARGAAIYDTGMQAAVIRAQKRFGLKPDGVAGPNTLAALNVSARDRIAQIEANMERWRWMPRRMPPTRVQVNSGAAVVTLFRDDRPVLSMKAVSGKPGDETPMLASEIHSVVLNPPWNVPTSIANSELWPKERANPGYLSRAGYQVLDGGRLQQRPGPDAALGLYKFDFDNPFAVYLHDTPAKAVFDRYARQASHGCVRVEKPAELAKALLAKDPQWSPLRIADAVSSGDTQRVRLPERVPVYILYWTAFAGADGQMHFRSDPYRWDSRLMGMIDDSVARRQQVAEAS